MKKEEFQGRYSVSDGYAGGSRPQYFKVRACDLDDEMTEDELREFYAQEMQSAFENRISPEAEREDEFVAWATEVLAARAAIAQAGSESNG